MAQAPLKDDTTTKSARERRTDRIRNLSRLMASGCLVVCVLLVVAMLFYWVTTPAQLLFSHAGLPVSPSTELDASVRIVALAISMVPLGVLIYGLLNARQCFVAFAAGHIFSGEPVARLKVFAIAVAASALLKPLAGAALSMLLSWDDVTGTRTLALTIDSDTLIALLFAGTVAVIAWVMAEAIEVSEENKQFV